MSVVLVIDLGNYKSRIRRVGITQVRADVVPHPEALHLSVAERIEAS